MLNISVLQGYWQGAPLQANILIALNLLGALLLGMLVGYERAYHGRAAGMRTYGLVCMASCALTVFVGYAHSWFGGAGSPVSPDPTRVVQGIVSGIGFLCAGVIMKDGLSVAGLTTAASLWAASAIGIMMGVGLYGAAVTLACLAMLAMTIGLVVEKHLPSKDCFGVVLKFKQGALPLEQDVAARTLTKGYSAQLSKMSISSEDGKMVWRFPLEAVSGRLKLSRVELAHVFTAMPNLESFSLEPVRH
jgi:putative Mg2+ transporter-C (MgtC) family protein